MSEAQDVFGLVVRVTIQYPSGLIMVVDIVR